MVEIYGARWSSSYGDPDGPTAQTWASGLAGVTPAQLAAGLSAAIASASPWPPTLPEYRAMCLGVPSLAAVRSDIGVRATPYGQLVWSYLDGYAYRTASRDVAARMLRDAYDQAREHVMRGGALPAVAAAIASPAGPRPAPAEPDVAAQYIASIDRMLGGVLGRPRAEMADPLTEPAA